MGSLTIHCAASLAFLAGTAAAQGTIFPANYWYPADNAPYGSRFADLNADGKQDYLVANYFTDKVSVYLGQGTGQFTPLGTVSVGGQPRSLVVADLDGDTKLDIVTANSTNNHVAVLLGDGLGGFGPPTPFATGFGTFPVWIDAGDLNGDGDIDIVTGNQATNSLSVLLGDGAGALGTASSHYVGYSPERIWLADMDGDTDLDCVSASWNDSRVSVLRNNGSGSFVVSADKYSSNPKGLAVGDVNADGRPDVVVVSSQNSHANVFLGNGLGGLLMPKDYYLGNPNLYPTSVMIADVSGEGRPDLITCNAGTPASLTVLIGVGGGNFYLGITSPIVEDAYDAIASDLNGDGFADVVASNQIDDSIRVYMTEGVGSWEHYCTPKTNSLGCVPLIYAVGTPSVSNVRPFWVYVYNVYDLKPGLFLYKVNGSQANIPFQGGTLCLGPGGGIRRTQGQMSGTDPEIPSPNCSGRYSLNFNAFASGLAGGNPDPGLLMIGNSYQLQVWSRDPGFAPPNNSGLTSAIDVTPWL